MYEKTGIKSDAYFSSPYGLPDDMVQLKTAICL